MLARMHPNFYVDLTGAWWEGGAPTLTFTAITSSGRDAWEKIVFGSDILKVEELKPAKEIHDRIFEPLKFACGHLLAPDLGKLRPGFHADVILVKEEVLSDLGLLQNVAHVIKDGVQYK